MPKRKAVATKNKKEAPKPAKEAKNLVNEKAEELYHECRKWRPALKERGMQFIVKDFPQYAEVIVLRGWEFIIETLKIAALTYVREFYANADHIRGYKSKIRNVDIKYDANTISG
ncbi:hypothetical protein L484_025578 [Morus notabilis]|uniref:Uncharacterized protein n=1 Tax=Morus notabilis TaxID=981085 RepID=W9RJ57_9ROSA|nr:hypothetical protein L484_025578 [Morus notabilis]